MSGDWVDVFWLRIFGPGTFNIEPQSIPTTHDLDRLKALTDGVIAVSITLLVLDIKLAPPLHELSDAELLAQYIAIWPKYLGYVISFIVVGVNWVSHQRKFRHIVRVDNGLMWLNLLFVLTVGLVPFTTTTRSCPGNTARVSR